MRWGSSLGAAVGLAASMLLSPSIAIGQDEETEAADAAPSVDAELASIREMVLYARYAEAETAASELLARPDLTPVQRNAALEIRAIILLARRQSARAEEVLRELYGRDPEHRLIDRDVGPAVRAAFERMQASRPPTAPVQLANDSLPRLDQRQSPVLAVRIEEGADVVHEIRLSYRNGETGPFERVLMRIDEARTLGRARVPVADGTDAYTVQYFVEALAPSQAVVASMGSESAPLLLEVPAESARPAILAAGDPEPAPAAGGSVAEEWWLWTLVGLVVAGGAATVGALYGTHVIGPPAPGSLGEGRL